jgi:hypothetical protein
MVDIFKIAILKNKNYTVFVLKACFLENNNSTIMISNKLMAVENTVFTIKYQTSPNCMASKKNSHPW